MITNQTIEKIDDVLINIIERLKAKGDIYVPDGEWTDLFEALTNLNNAKCLLKRRIKQQPINPTI